jgi:hypothetical protein
MHPIENYIPLILSLMCEAIINLIRFKISLQKIRNHNYFTTDDVLTIFFVVISLMNFLLSSADTFTTLESEYLRFTLHYKSKN